jgi:serine kinase of HPr protein (carbohydrate metabolism regulator)
MVDRFNERHLPMGMSFPVSHLLTSSQNPYFFLLAGFQGVSRQISQPEMRHVSGLIFRDFHPEQPPFRLGGQSCKGQLLVCDGHNESILKWPTPTVLQRLEALFQWNGAALLIFSYQHAISPLIIDLADRLNYPLLATQSAYADLQKTLSAFLLHRLDAWVSGHGCLVSVYGMGILMVGPSGVGKSECTLDLLMRGHQLVADDFVVLKKNAEGRLIGSAKPSLRKMMVVKGVGLIHVDELLGPDFFREEHEVDMVVSLQEWKKHQESDPLGLEEQNVTILETELPLYRLPVAPGRNLANLVTLAARKQLWHREEIKLAPLPWQRFKSFGFFSEKEF